MGYKISLELFKNKKNKKSYDELQSGRLLLGHPVLSCIYYFSKFIKAYKIFYSLFIFILFKIYNFLNILKNTIMSIPLTQVENKFIWI